MMTNGQIITTRKSLGAKRFNQEQFFPKKISSSPLSLCFNEAPLRWEGMGVARFPPHLKQGTP
jgi:hypothetical protein